MKIIHLSDLHFGTESPDVVDYLKNAIGNVGPDLVIVSGDFTQKASKNEFCAAKKFLDSLPSPWFAVPGNHDIPPYNLLKRFFSPYKKYKRFINNNLCPTFENDAVVIAGINSARRMVFHWNWANGAISAAQLAKLEKIFENKQHKRRICVFHHPIHVALNMHMKTVVFGARSALNKINDLKVDLVLTGHVHHASVTSFGDMDHRTIYLSASTALSSRLREQENGFNVITINKDKMVIELYVYDGKTGFVAKEKYEQ